MPATTTIDQAMVITRRILQEMQDDISKASASPSTVAPARNSSFSWMEPVLIVVLVIIAAIVAIGCS
jgi:cell division protein FtsL